MHEGSPEALADELAEPALAMLLPGKAVLHEGSPETLADELAELALAMLADELALAMTSCPAIERYCMREVQRL